MPTFAKAEAACFAEKREVWRTDGAQHWRGPMDRYVLPKLGAMPVDKVGSAAVYEVLRPLALAGTRRRPRGVAPLPASGQTTPATPRENCRIPRCACPAEPGALAALDPAAAGETMIGQTRRSRECAGGSRLFVP